MCIAGDEVCTHDNRGCEVCTCKCSGTTCKTSGSSSFDDHKEETGNVPVWGPER
jgi:hypothetical protein